MEENPRIINNKEKQSVGGNWGSNKFVKRHTEIPDPLIKTDEVNYSLRKKRKKAKKKLISVFEVCPFCNKELKMLETKTQPSKFHFLSLFNRETWCRECGASQVPECPACRKKTWLNKEGIYKHPYVGCGFKGKLRKDGN